MNRFSVTCMACIIMAWVGGLAADSPVAFGEVTVEPDAVVQGSTVAVSIPFECEPDWRYLAYRVGVYRPCAPSACAKGAPWPLSESKHGREWDSYTIRKWTWRSRKLPQASRLDFSLDTADWPPGDYQLHVALLFRSSIPTTAQGGRKRDRYLQRAILLSVLAPPRERVLENN